MEREILMKSLVGSHNYNLANEESDKDYKVFVAPTFVDLYTGKRYKKQTITETEDCDIKDIRNLVELLFKANINYLEVLASNELIIPEGLPEIEEIISRKKEVFRMNLPYFFNACKGMFHQKMALLHKGTEGTQHLVEQFGYDTKQALHAYRCLKVVVDFCESDFEDFEGAIRYEGQDLEFMKEIRQGFYHKNVFENFVTHYYESCFLPLEQKYKEQPVNLALKEELEEIVMKLIQRKLLSNEAIDIYNV